MYKLRSGEKRQIMRLIAAERGINPNGCTDNQLAELRELMDELGLAHIIEARKVMKPTEYKVVVAAT